MYGPGLMSQIGPSKAQYGHQGADCATRKKFGGAKSNFTKKAVQLHEKDDLQPRPGPLALGQTSGKAF